MANSRTTGAVLFDLGNVLVPFSHDRMVQQVAECLGVDVAAIRGMLMDGGLLRAYERGEISTSEMYERITAHAPRRPTLEELSRAASDIFWPEQEMEELALRLVHRGVPVVVVSNTCPIHVAWIEERFPFFCQIPHRVLSYEVGASKPERLIYERALEVAGVGPEEALFFDDRPENVVAARELGIDAHIFESPQQVKEILASRGLL